MTGMTMFTAEKLRPKRRARGLAVIELTLVLPIVLLLMVATAELGRAFWQYNTLTKSVRDGARHASSAGLFGSTGVVVVTDELRTQVQNLVVYGNTAGTGAPLLNGLSTSGVSLESPGGGDILVRSSFDYDPIFGFLPDFRGGGWSTLYEFEAVVRMRAL
jgi:hypothetical protein